MTSRTSTSSTPTRRNYHHSGVLRAAAVFLMFIMSTHGVTTSLSVSMTALPRAVIEMACVVYKAAIEAVCGLGSLYGAIEAE